MDIVVLGRPKSTFSHVVGAMSTGCSGQNSLQVSLVVCLVTGIDAPEMLVGEDEAYQGLDQFRQILGPACRHPAPGSAARL